MTKVKSICVFCGSSSRVDDTHRIAAARLGSLLADQGIELVFGGGAVGLMGIIADAALARGGRVVGVIPRHLQEFEVGHTGLTELIVVDGMHTRKARMFALADAFVILPGGFGTLDEMFEILTWKQIRLHDKPIVLVDNDGYWAPLRELIEHIVANGFAHADNLDLLRVVAGVDEVLPLLRVEPQPHFPAIDNLI